MSNLTDKQEIFCQEYLIDFNASAAYIRAGYSAKTRASVDSSSSALLRNPKIQYRIYELKCHRSRRVSISQERILNELAKIAFVDIRNVVTFVETQDKKIVMRINLASDDDCAAISEITENKDGIKVKFHDKTKALELLMKHTGLLHDFDLAIAALEKYGLVIRKDEENGAWQIIEALKK